MNQHTPAQLRDMAKTFMVAFNHQDQQAFTTLAMLSWKTGIDPDSCVQRIAEFATWSPN